MSILKSVKTVAFFVGGRRPGVRRRGLAFLLLCCVGAAGAALPPVTAYEDKLRAGWGIEKVLRRLHSDGRAEEERLRAAHRAAKKRAARARRTTGLRLSDNTGALDASLAAQLKDLRRRQTAYAERLRNRFRSIAAETPPAPITIPPTPPPSTSAPIPPPPPPPKEATPVPSAAPLPPRPASPPTPAAVKPDVPPAPRDPLPEFVGALARGTNGTDETLDFEPARLEIHGHAAELLAYRAARPAGVRRQKSSLFLEQTWRPTDDLRFVFSQRVTYDFSVRQRNRDTEGLSETEKDNNESTAEWREAYLDWNPGLVTLRLGAQQVVWGEAVGLFVADVVNARDWREIILPETWLIRLPQWALHLSRTSGLFSQELVVLLPRTNRWPSVDSDFFFLPDEAGPLVRDVDLTAIEDRPVPWRLSMLEVGARTALLTGGLDVAVFYLGSFEKDPLYFRNPSATTFSGEFEIRHPRQTTWGLTFSKDVGDSIVKGEFVVKPRKYVSIDTPGDEDNVDRRTHYDGMLGVDATFIDRWDANLQLIDRFVPDATEELIRVERNRLYAAARLSRKYRNGTWETELVALRHVGKNDALFRPKVYWKATDWVTVKVGADLFDGKDPEGIFSVYDAQDRFFTEVSLHF